jgi:DNA (cytosine-5)-methyltransferase 1
VSATLKGNRGKDGSAVDLDQVVAAPLMFGSSRGGSNSLRPGFTGDGHIVTGPLGGGNDGVGRRHEDDPNLVTAAGVRRLTPRECERLQGLPDGWTLLDPCTPDSRRYAALGDAVTVPVAEWIGCQLADTGGET